MKVYIIAKQRNPLKLLFYFTKLSVISRTINTTLPGKIFNVYGDEMVTPVSKQSVRMLNVFHSETRTKGKLL